MTVNRFDVLLTIRECNNDELFVIHALNSNSICFKAEAVSTLPCPPFCEENFVCITYSANDVVTYLNSINEDPDAEIGNKNALIFTNKVTNAQESINSLNDFDIKVLY